MMKNTPPVLIPATDVPEEEILDFFGSNGLCAGCFCRYWYKRHKDYEADKYESNRQEFIQDIRNGRNTGYLVKKGIEFVGWVSMNPKAEYLRIRLSRTIDPEGLDDLQYWSLPCVYVKPKWRKKGLSEAIIQLAIERAREQGAQWIEAYPVFQKPGKEYAPPFAWTGFHTTFEKCGFQLKHNRKGSKKVYKREL